MKKTLFILTMLTFVLVANAQTDFRHITFDEAKAAAKAENKMIFVDFFTEWCGPCKRLAKLVFPTKEVGDFLNAGYVCLKLDAEKEGKELAAACHVEGYPTLAVFNADGEMTGSFAGYKEGKDFINSVKDITDPNMKPEIVEQKYLSGDRTPGVVKGYARNKFESGRTWEECKANVEPIISEYFNSLSDSDRLNPENSFVFCSYTFDYDSPRAQFLIANRNKFDGSVKEETEQSLRQLFQSQAINYLASNNLGNPADYEQYKTFSKSLQDNGLTDEYGTYLAFAEKRRTSGDEEYLDYCDKNFDTLDPTGVHYLISSLPELVSSDTKEKKANISKLIRKHLADMDAANIYNAGQILYRLEIDNQ